MNIKRVKEELKDTINAYLLKDENGEYVIPSIRQRPILLIGPPGVGKTQIMEQAARECKIGLVSYTITHHTRQSAVGLPFIEHKTFGGKEYALTEYTMSEIVASVYNKMEETGLKEGILFLDEINCVSETLAPAMLQFLQCKTFGTHKIPEGWIVAAAGNPPEYNKSVREFDIVTLDRIRKITVEPDFGVWKEYAYRQEMHPAVVSYLEIKPQYLFQMETTVDGKRFTTPRGWEDLSCLLKVYETLGKKADREVVAQYLQHPKVSKDFANYLELYYKYQKDYQVEEILNGVIRENLCDRLARADFDERLSVTGLLLSKLLEGFRELYEKNKTMELLMEQLKRFQKEQAENAGAKTPEVRLKQLFEEMETRRKHGRESGLLGKKEEGRIRKAEKILESYAEALRLASLTGDEEAWNWLREQFMSESDAYEEKKALCGKRLECAFDFMEAAFAGGQEMVIFITELNTAPSSVFFLREYSCERYFQYNKTLLFEDVEEKIREEMKKLGRE